MNDSDTISELLKANLELNARLVDMKYLVLSYQEDIKKIKTELEQTRGFLNNAEAAIKIHQAVKNYEDSR